MSSQVSTLSSFSMARFVFLRFAFHPMKTTKKQTKNLSSFSMAMVRFSFCFETKHGGYVLVFVHLLNVLSSDGIPIRAGDDIDGDDSEELQYEWSTEGEREIEPGRDSPQVDQVSFPLSLVGSYNRNLRSCCQSTSTRVSESRRWPRSSRRAIWRRNRYLSNHNGQ